MVDEPPLAVDNRSELVAVEATAEGAEASCDIAIIDREVYPVLLAGATFGSFGFRSDQQQSRLLRGRQSRCFESLLRPPQDDDVASDRAVHRVVAT